MKKWIICFVCVFLLSVLSACRADPDIILRGSETVSAGEEVLPSLEDRGEEPQEQAELPQGIFVYICGAVCSPGVYEVPADSRIYEVVERAGGMTADAAGEQVNLAQAVADGQMVRIPFQSEAQPDGELPQETGPSGIAPDGRVNINTATAEELMTLPGIGQTKADQIIAYREANGAFPKTEAIMQVSGIAAGTYEKIRDRITVQ